MSWPQNGRAACPNTEGRQEWQRGRGSLGPERDPGGGWTACLLSPHLLPALQVLLWHSALWTVQEATPLAPAGSLPPGFLLKCLEQVRKIQADGVALQERLVSERDRQRVGLWRKEDPEGIAEGEREPHNTIRKGSGRGETGRKGSTLVKVELHEAGKPLGNDNPMGTVLAGPGWDGRAHQQG